MLPTYNEVESLEGILGRIRQWVPRAMFGATEWGIFGIGCPRVRAGRQTEK